MQKLLITLIVLAVAPLTLAQEKTGVDAYEAKELKYTGGEYKDHAFAYRLMKPAKIEPGRKYPLIVFLHGAGERGADNLAQLKFLPTWMSTAEMREKYPCYLLAPQCPTNHKWVNVDWSAKKNAMPDEPADEMKAVIEMLHRTMKEEAVDSDRVYLTGLSMGGYGTWDLAARHADWFAAAAPICGGGDENQAGKYVGLPLWAWHGDADNAVPVQRSRNMIEAIKKAGGEPKYTELPGVGHNSWTEAYTRADGVVPWLFEQKRGK
ncbi:MAG: prolyl oligopeptidase family serine peptidase [Planctomycetes bacterium]|nr:prolyl oligopeptidase family serine peptidase [Planctomycetota bacterium]